MAQQSAKFATSLDNDDADALNMKVLTAAVRSDKWWAYTSMLATSHHFVACLGRWSESCPCHDWLKRSGEEGYSLSAQALDLWRDHLHMNGSDCMRADGTKYSPCPLAGKRAVELALGLFEAMFDTLLKQFLPAIMEACENLSTEDLQFILNDWEHARAHMLEQCRLKLQFWTVLPWRAIALADWNPQRLVTTAISLLEEFERCPVESKHHRITWSLFSAASPYRLEIEALANGASMRDLPLLRRWAAAALFTPTAERRQEADHATIARAGRRNCSGAYNSLQLRLPQLERLCSTQDGWARCTRVYRELTDVRVAARRLGLHNHPVWKIALENKRRKRDLAQIIGQLLYGLDIDTQYQAMNVVQKKRKDHAKKLKDAARGGPAGKLTFSREELRRQSLVKHVQRVLRPGRLYSAPARAFHVRPMGHADLKHGGMDMEVAGSLELDVGCEEESVVPVAVPERTDIADQIVFFRVVTTRPSRGQFVYLPAAAGAGLHLRADDVCLTFHRAYVIANTTHVNVQPLPASSSKLGIDISIMNLLSGDLSLLEAGLREWSRGRKACFLLDGCDPSLFSSLLEALHSSGAYPTSDSVLCVAGHDQERRDLLLALEQRGLTEQVAVRVDASTEWRFTCKGVSHLSFAQQLVEPSVVCSRLPLGSGVPHDATEFQLFMLLDERGWQVRKAPGKKQERLLLPPATKGGDRIWYVGGTDLVRIRSYLLCLVHIDTLDNVVEIHPFQEQKYYAQILDGSGDGRRVVAAPAIADVAREPLELDVEDQPMLQLEDVPLPPHLGQEVAVELVSDGEVSDASDVQSDQSGQSFGSGGNAGETHDGGGADDVVNDVGVDAGDVPSGSDQVRGDAKRRRVDRQVHKDTVMWGPFRLTFKKASEGCPHGSWQATCPYHRLNTKTKCTKTRQLTTAADSDAAKLYVMRWCMEAAAFPRKKLHAKFRPVASNMLPEALMQAQVHMLPEPPSREEMLASLTDEILDLIEGKSQPPPEKKEKKRRARAKVGAKRQEPTTDGGHA